MPIGAREAALSALTAYRRRGARPDIVLKNLKNSNKLGNRDMALAVNIVNGVLQNETLCDYYISLFTNLPITKIEPDVLEILRISAYQLFFLARVPSHAVVSEGVNLAKSHSKRASGLVNAVLRKLADVRVDPPAVDSSDKVKYLSIMYSHPEWLVNYLILEYGYDKCKLILSSNNREPGITIQTNRLKIEPAALFERLKDECSANIYEGNLTGSFKLMGAGDLTSLPSFKDGLFYVQDEAARMAVSASGILPYMTVIDVCSAPGGKSFAAAIDMGNSGHIFSFDINSKKLNMISSGANRLGISIIQTGTQDARLADEELIGKGDVVIADVPCSGFGVIRKKPEIRFKSPDEISRLPDIQFEILSNVSNYVKPGGVLLYSTCTILREENQNVIERFLNNDSRFSLETFELPIDVNSSDGMAVILPYIADTDGFFICKMRRVQ